MDFPGRSAESTGRCRFPFEFPTFPAMASTSPISDVYEGDVEEEEEDNYDNREDSDSTASTTTIVMVGQDYENQLSLLSRTRLPFPQAEESLAYDNLSQYEKRWRPEEDDGLYSEVEHPETRAETFKFVMERSPDGCSDVSPVSLSSSSLSDGPIYESLLQARATRDEESRQKKGALQILLLCFLGVTTLLCGLLPALYFALSNSKTLTLVEQRFSLLPDDKWYHFSANATTFPEARAACAGFGSRLVEVRSQGAHSVLTGHLSSLRVRHWWLAATDRGDEGTFVWMSDNSPVDETFPNASDVWARGQPDNWPNQEGEPEEDCLTYMFDLDGQQRWKWNDLDCLAKANFVCQL